MEKACLLYTHGWWVIFSVLDLGSQGPQPLPWIRSLTLELLWINFTKLLGSLVKINHTWILYFVRVSQMGVWYCLFAHLPVTREGLVDSFIHNSHVRILAPSMDVRRSQGALLLYRDRTIAQCINHGVWMHAHKIPDHMSQLWEPVLHGNRDPCKFTP